MLVKKIAIITTHPVQYNAPFFKLLAASTHLSVKVFYTWGETVVHSKYDPGFDKKIIWDLPLLEGYDFEFLKNTAAEKGSHHYKGISNPDIIAKIKEFKADAILVYGWKFQSHLKAMRYFKNKVPVWFRGDSTLLDEKRNFENIIRRMFLKWVYSHVDIAFYTGTNNKKYFLTHGLKERQLIKAVHAVDNERFFNSGGRYSPKAKEIKEELNITPGQLIFLYAGKLEPKKDVGTLCRAFVALDIEHTHLIVVGNGPAENYLKATYGHHNSISFLDFQNQFTMPVIYQLCDVFILPSTGPGESWGLALNEAMAAGKAVLASDKCGGAADLICDGENGYIFQAGDVAGLVSKMKRIVVSSDDLDKMKHKSLEKIRGFDFERFVSSLENVLNENGSDT